MVQKTIFFLLSIAYIIFFLYLCVAKTQKYTIMSYLQMAQLEVLNAVKGINNQADFNDFRDMIARYFAQKAQQAIDAMWDQGSIDEQVVENWGNEHMRTPYRHATHRS